MDNSFKITLIAAEDMADAQYLAVALDDGKVANNGEEAMGILEGDGHLSGDHITLLYIGESIFIAGGAITKGDHLTISTSGYITTAGSYDAVIGEAKYTTTSGSQGRGVFDFVGKRFPSITNNVDARNAKDTLVEGVSVGSGDLPHDVGKTHTGFADAAVSSGGAYNLIVSGVGGVLIGGGTITEGVQLKVTGSGFMVAAGSGDEYNAVLLASTASGMVGKAAIGGGYVST